MSRGAQSLDRMKEKEARAQCKGSICFSCLIMACHIVISVADAHGVVTLLNQNPPLSK